jgi:hypothetical protein
MLSYKFDQLDSPYVIAAPCVLRTKNRDKS